MVLMIDLQTIENIWKSTAKGAGIQFHIHVFIYSPENWLEDVFPTKIGLFWGHVSFQGCIQNNNSRFH